MKTNCVRTFCVRTKTILDYHLVYTQRGFSSGLKITCIIRFSVFVETVFTS